MLLAAGAVAVTSIAAVSMTLTYGLLEDSHEGDFKLMRQIFETKLGAYRAEAVGGAEVLSTVPGIRKAFLDRDRKALIEECGGIFQVQTEKYDIDHAQFHEPGAISFLRLHNPSKFGDDQTSWRPMLVDAQREEAIRDGLELTLRGPMIAGIVPIFDAQKQFQGTFEIGLEPEAMFDELKKNYEIEGAFYLDEDMLRAVGTEIPSATFAKHKLLGSFVRFHSTNEELLADLVKSNEIGVDAEKHFTRTADGTVWGVQLLPMYNQAHKKIAVAVLATNFGDDRSAALRAMVWEGLAALFSIVLLAGVLLVAVKGWLLAPIRTMSERLRLVAAGEDPGPDPIAGEYCEELTELAESCETLRTKGERA